MRKFITPVLMTCESEEQQREMIESLKKIGYSTENGNASIQFDLYPIVCTDMNGNHDEIGTTKGRISEFEGAIHTTNPDLFLALASMSEGDEFYPGEMVVCLWKGSSRFHEDKIYKITKIDDDRGNVRILGIDEFGEENWMYLYPTKTDKNPNFRKATAEEIIQHFAKVEKKEDYSDVFPGHPKEENPKVNLPNFEYYINRDKTISQMIAGIDSKNEGKSFFDQNPTPLPDYDTPNPTDIPSRNDWEKVRIKALLGAISAYVDEDKTLPDEWVNELGDLLNKRAEDLPF